MRITITSSTQLQQGDLRLDGSYYANDCIRTIQQLKTWAVKQKRQLANLIDIAELFNGPRFARIYVVNKNQGIPFLSSSDMLSADFSGIKYLSKKLTPSSLVKKILLSYGWTLISCSGTIGNTVYVRSDMQYMTGSQHIMRAAPKKDQIPSGYLFAYLSSEIAYLLISQGTYGAVIQHIEPQHIANLPVPRLETNRELEIHELIENAAKLRVTANQQIKSTVQRFYREVLNLNEEELDWKSREYHNAAVGNSHFSSLDHRLDAFHYIGYAGEADQWLSKPIPMGDLVNPFQPPLFKRPYTDNNGIPFLSGIDLFNVYPKPHMYISKKIKDLDQYIVKAGTILVQRVGQRYGLFGRPTILPKHLDGAAVTEHLYRLYLKDNRDRGFIYTWLLTEIGRRLLLKQSFGTSMGVLDANSFKRMPVPDCSSDLRYMFEQEVQLVCSLRDEANSLEDRAQVILTNELGFTTQE